MSDTNPKPTAASPIRIDEVYTLAEFQRRTGLKRNAMRTARRRGLPVRQCGRNKYVVGAEWVTFLQTVGTTDSGDR
jgi:hypothetical protein